MDTINTSNWTDNSSFVRNVSTDSFNSTGRARAGTLTVENIVLLAISAFGLPGNVLVIAVYLRQMTTSTKVYMFSLAVVDTVVCVCAITLSTGLTQYRTTALITLFVLDTAVNFSMFLLTCVSIERLLAVTRPHTFNMDAQRAKKVLLFLTLAALACTVIKNLISNVKNKLYVIIFVSTLIGGEVMIMAGSYVVVAIKLFSRRRITKYQREVRRRDGTSGSSMATVSSNVCETSADEKDTSNEATGSRDTSFELDSSSVSQTHHVTSKKTARDDTRMYKNVTLLFVITVVFVVSWTPQWLNIYGIPVPTMLRRMFVLNSVVNPFIYGVVSAMFREDVRAFYRQIRTKMSCC